MQERGRDADDLAVAHGEADGRARVERGATAAEYALVLCLIGGVVAILGKGIGVSVSDGLATLSEAFQGELSGVNDAGQPTELAGGFVTAEPSGDDTDEASAPVATPPPAPAPAEPVATPVVTAAGGTADGGAGEAGSEPLDDSEPTAASDPVADPVAGSEPDGPTGEPVPVAAPDAAHAETLRGVEAPVPDVDPTAAAPTPTSATGGEWSGTVTLVNRTDREQFLTVDVVRTHADGATAVEVIDGFAVGANATANLVVTNPAPGPDGEAQVVSVEVRVRAVSVVDDDGNRTTTEVAGPVATLDVPR